MRPEPRLLKDRTDLTRLSERLKSEGKTVVTINGCFDLIHSGHVHILTEAKKQGDALIVGLNSDASVRAYKGEGRPVLPEDERAAILLALEPVDYVCLYDETECLDFVAAARPDVHVNDASYGEHCVEADTVRRVGARLHLVPKKDGCSTSNIVSKARA